MFSQEHYLSTMKSRLENNFRFSKNLKLFSSNFDLVAIYEEISGRTFVSKVDVIDRLDKYERMYFKYMETADRNSIELISEDMIKWAEKFTPDNKEHMSTILTGIIYADSIDNDTIEWVKKFKYTKYYSFALKGWCDIRFVIVNLTTNDIYTCKKASHVKDVFDITAKLSKKENTNKVLNALSKLFH